MTPEHTPAVFKESFKLQNMLVRQRASSPPVRDEGAAIRSLRPEGTVDCCLMKESSVHIVIIWYCGVCSCVCVIVTVFSTERGVRGPDNRWLCL